MLCYRARDLTEVTEEDLYLMSSGEHYPVFVEDTEHGFLSKRITMPGQYFWVFLLVLMFMFCCCFIYLFFSKNKRKQDQHVVAGTFQNIL